jgi:hypothetical protein
VLTHIHPLRYRFTYWLGIQWRLPAYLILSSGLCLFECPLSAESPFARSRRYLSRCDLQITSERVTPPSSLILAHAPDQDPLSDLVSLFQRVFAGCHQSLLEIGPSRRYLCNPCIGAWTLTPRCFFGAFARFFPKNIGLTLD